MIVRTSMAKKLKVTQIKSSIGAQKAKHVSVLQSLGLRKNYRTIYKNDNPQIRGMLRKVSHLVRWEEIDEKSIPSEEKGSSGLTPAGKSGTKKKAAAAGGSGTGKGKKGKGTKES
jgi:large subunit ribosomal protein L30